MYSSGGGCTACSQQRSSGPVMPMTSQWTQYQGNRSVVPVMNQQPSMIMPQQASRFYANPAPTNQMMSYQAPANQMVSYTASNQQLTNMDSMAYSRYVSQPPQDVQYTLNNGMSAGGAYSDYPVDGWNGMWRQSSTAYKEGQLVQQVPQQQQMVTYATQQAPMMGGMMQRVVNVPTGGYYG